MQCLAVAGLVCSNFFSFCLQIYVLYCVLYSTVADMRFVSCFSKAMMMTMIMSVTLSVGCDTVKLAICHC